MHVAQEDVVSVLQANVFVFQYIFVVKRGQNRTDSRLTDFAAQTAVTVSFQYLFKGAVAFHTNDVGQLFTGMAEVLTNIGVHFYAQVGQLQINDLLNQGGTTATTG